MPLSPSSTPPQIVPDTPPKPIVIPATSKHTATVILLHVRLSPCVYTTLYRIMTLFGVLNLLITL